MINHCKRCGCSLGLMDGNYCKNCKEHLPLHKKFIEDLEDTAFHNKTNMEEKYGNKKDK